MTTPDAASLIAVPRPATVPNAVQLHAKPFDLNRVRLLESPFHEAMEKNAEYLLQLEPDRLLNRFRLSSGLEPKGESYGGWEQMTIAGHTLGHYLTAICYQYRATGDDRFLEIAEYIVSELRECQNARKDGYVGGVPEGDRVWEELKRGQIVSKGFDLNGIWVPWYNLHKLWMGLYDAFTLCGIRDAFDIVVKLSDWAIDVTSNLNDDLWDAMLACEHGGMNEALAQIYGITGEKRYLDLAIKFNHKAVLEPLAQGEDSLPGLHGNTQIPKVIGAAREYELTGDSKFKDISANFWNSVVNDHTYAIGGHGSGEYFGPSRQLADRLTMTTAETCNTYNMLKLTKQLFSWDPKVEYADYYEQAMLNHILPSQDRATGMLCYFVSLHPGHFKTYSTPYDAFWCCVGTGIENHTRYGESIYFHNDDSLYVNLYVPSVLDWREKNVQVSMETDYPKSETVKIKIATDSKTRFKLKIRCPRWSEGKIDASVRGETYSGEPGTFLEIDRVWTNEDSVDIRIPMSLRVLPTPDNDKRVALAYGPVVLAGDLGSDGIVDPMPFTHENAEYFGVPCPSVPVLVTNGKDVGDWVQPVEGEPLHFKTVGVGQPNEVSLLPFYEIERNRYSVYWDLFDDQSWENQKEAYLAKQQEEKRLQSVTVDYVQFGEMQPERDHSVDGEKTSAEGHAGHKMRIAWHGGWFSCKMRTPAHDRVALVVDYWGQDGRNREFDILIDGELLAHEKFSVDNHNRFFSVTYPIEMRLVEGKNEVSITFRSSDNKIVGPVCSVRTIRA